MAKEKSVFVCGECGESHSKWAGKCNGCGAWNTLTEERAKPQATASNTNRYSGYAQRSELTPLNAVKKDEFARVSTKSIELDRVLGGGLVPGSVLLIGGDPGIGKSTLLLQVMDKLSKNQKVIYISGEESKEQIALRAERLGIDSDMSLLPESHLETILAVMENEKPQMMVVDSIQTIYSDALQSAPGSVGQVRESAAQMTRMAKSNGITLFLVGHVTKDGQLAGPRVLEHIVDTVLYFEGDENADYRLLRAIKNRFGAVNEVGVFAMTEDGLIDVVDPSSVFLGQDRQPVAGSCITITQEGSRGILVEIQALVDQSKQPNPRRLAVGLDHQRVAMLLAVLNKSAGMQTHDCDVFVSVVGGLKLTEPAVDLAALLAVVSSLKVAALPEGLAVIGEVDLTGKVRPVRHATERISEAVKMGFKDIIIPYGNKPKKQQAIKCHLVKNVYEALSAIKNLQ
jgi:DNA repair protein RadA/Sms